MGARAVLQERGPSPSRRERDAAVRERRVGPEAAALAPARARGRRRRARCPTTRASETPERAEQERAGDDSEQRGSPSAAAIRGRTSPEREVEHDPGAAREREQREDEPDERDVDAEGLRDSRADPGEHPLVSARVRRSCSGIAAHRTARSTRTWTDADVRVEDEHVRAGLDDRRSGVAAVVRLAPRMSTSPSSASPRHAQRASFGTITRRSPTSTRALTCVSPTGKLTSR